jgi:hypothetical protein
MANHTTWHVRTDTINSDGHFERNTDGSDFPVTICGIMAALATADNAGFGWYVVLERRKRFRIYNDAVHFIARHGEFAGGGKVPKKFVKICRDAVSRHDFAKNALAPAVSPQA